MKCPKCKNKLIKIADAHHVITAAGKLKVIAGFFCNTCCISLTLEEK